MFAEPPAPESFDDALVPIAQHPLTPLRALLATRLGRLLEFQTDADLLRLYETVRGHPLRMDEFSLFEAHLYLALAEPSGEPTEDDDSRFPGLYL